MQSGGRDITGLLAALEADADAEAARLDDEVRREAHAIVDAAWAEAAGLQREPVDAQAPALAAEVARRLAAARLDANRAVRLAHEACVQEALGELRTRLAAVREGAEHPRVFTALLAEALALLPEAGRLLVDPRDVELARGAVAELGLDLAIDAALETWGGVVAGDAEGRAARNTLEERLANAEPALRVELTRIAVSALDGGARWG